MTWAQDQRIAFIKARIEGGGRVTRREIAQRFNCTLQTVTTTFHVFKAKYPGLMALDQKAKAYTRADIAELGQRPWKERALAAEAALRAVVKIRPKNWDDDEDPEQLAAWKLVAAALGDEASDVG